MARAHRSVDKAVRSADVVVHASSVHAGAARLCLLALLATPALAADPFKFTDVTDPSGLKPHVAGALNHAVAWGDVDNDGLLDLFLGNFDKGGNEKYGLKESIPNAIFRQSAPGKFERLAAGVETRGRTSGAAFVDLDNDGDVDLVVLENTHPPDSKGLPSTKFASRVYRNDGNLKFTDVTDGSGFGGLLYARDVAVLDYDKDGLLDLLVLEDNVFQKTAHSKLFRNEGNFKFKDVTKDAGLPTDLYGFGCAVSDVNNDGRADVFVAGSNRLFLGTHQSKFTEADHLRQVFDIGAKNKEDFTAGAAFGDIDNDRDLDLITGPHHIPAKIRAYLNERPGDDDKVRFRDVTKELNLPELPQKAPTVAIADFDHDGFQDLYFSAWFTDGPTRTPYIARNAGVKDFKATFELPGLDGLDLAGAKKNTASEGKRGIVYYVDGPPVDYDNDGDLDFFAGIWPDENSRLLRNDTPNLGNWLKVSVRGTKTNRMGIGTKIRVVSFARVIAYRDLTMNSGYSGSHPPTAHVGLGQLDTVDLELWLPSRRDPILMKNVKANQHLIVDEPKD